MRLLPRPTDFGSALRSPRVTTHVGLWLGACFGLAFLTGLLSHLAYSPDGWWPTRPVWGYRLTQGLHVVSGTAAVPLLLVKLWSVYPRLFARPPRQFRELLLHGAERASIGVLVATALFQLASGLTNAARWYPWSFSFRATHYATAWVVIGALIVHVAVKLPVVRAALTGPRDEPDPTVAPTAAPADVPGEAAAEAQGDPPLSRRGLLWVTGGAAGAAVLATAGGTVPLLRPVSVFATTAGTGPGGVPVNKSAVAAGVVAAAMSPDYRLEIRYGDRLLTLARSELLALPQTTAELPIACVEGWSAQGEWTGVRLRDLLDRVGAPAGVAVQAVSLQPSGPFRTSVLPADFADDPLALVALGLSGGPLDLDHGFPCRLIAPNRPGVLQTKWLAELTVLP